MFILIKNDNREEGGGSVPRPGAFASTQKQLKRTIRQDSWPRAPRNALKGMYRVISNIYPWKDHQAKGIFFL